MSQEELECVVQVRLSFYQPRYPGKTSWMIELMESRRWYSRSNPSTDSAHSNSGRPQCLYISISINKSRSTSQGQHQHLQLIHPKLENTAQNPPRQTSHASNPPSGKSLGFGPVGFVSGPFSGSGCGVGDWLSWDGLVVSVSTFTCESDDGMVVDESESRRGGFSSDWSILLYGATLNLSWIEVMEDGMPFLFAEERKDEELLAYYISGPWEVKHPDPHQGSNSAMIHNGKQSFPATCSLKSS